MRPDIGGCLDSRQAVLQVSGNPWPRMRAGCGPNDGGRQTSQKALHHQVRGQCVPRATPPGRSEVGLGARWSRLVAGECTPDLRRVKRQRQKSLQPAEAPNLRLHLRLLQAPPFSFSSFPSLPHQPQPFSASSPSQPRSPSAPPSKLHRHSHPATVILHWPASFTAACSLVNSLKFLIRN